MKIYATEKLLEKMTENFLNAESLANLSGVSLGTINKCIAGFPVTMTVAKKICSYFDCSFSDIFKADRGM